MMQEEKQRMAQTTFSKYAEVLVLIISLIGCRPDFLQDPSDDGREGMGEFHIGRSAHFEQKGAYRRALSELEKGLAESPNNPRIYFNIGTLKLNQGLFEEAAGAFEKAAELYKVRKRHANYQDNDPFDRLDATEDNLAFTYTLLGRYDEAIALHQAVRNPPFDDYVPDRGLAVALMLKGDPERSFHHLDFYLKHIEKTDPGQTSMVKGLMEKVAQGQISRQALLGYLRALATVYDREKSLSFLQPAIAEAPDEPAIRMLLSGWEATDRGENKEAVARRAGRVQHIRSLLASSKSVEAVRAAKKFLKEYPQDPTGYMMVGIAYGQMGEIAKSIEAYKEGLSIMPQSDALNYNLAHTYFVTERLTEAEYYAQKVIEINAKYPDVHSLLAKIRVAQHQYENAINFLVREADISGGAQVLADIGEIYYQHLKNYRKAIEYYDEALKQNPNDLEVLNWKADAYYQLGDIRKARDVSVELKSKLEELPNSKEMVHQVEAWIRELEGQINSRD